MGFGMFSVHHSPIAIDFGSASVKLLQLGSGARPPLLAAAELPIPDPIRSDNDRLFSYFEEWLPTSLRDGKFKGRRAVISVPALQTFIHHMQITESEGVSRDDLIKGQLQTQMGCPPHGVVVRPIDVCTVYRNGQTQKEVICLAITKDTVMRYVELLKKLKLEVAGVHTDTLAMVRGFDHLYHREENDSISTLFIDLGWGGTRVAVTHGKQVVFSRHIPIGGRHFDQLIASATRSDLASARAHRLTLRSPKPQAMAAEDFQQVVPDTAASSLETAIEHATMTAFKPTKSTARSTVDRQSGIVPASLHQSSLASNIHRPANIDFTELVDTITDEISMCLRYHEGLFRDRQINRAIFVGGESRQAWLCQQIVKALRVPAQMGDPLGRCDVTHTPPTPGLKLGEPQPGWAVAYGLCLAPNAT